MKKTNNSLAIILCLILMVSAFASCNTISNNKEESFVELTSSQSNNTNETTDNTANAEITTSENKNENTLVNFQYTIDDCHRPSMTSVNRNPEDFDKYLEYDFAKYRPWYNVGVCRKLSGEQTVVLFFLDDDESQWDKDSINLYTEKCIKPAFDFLLRESEKWNNNLSFKVKRYSTAISEDITLKYNGIINVNLNNGGSTKDVPDQLAKALGYCYNMELLKALDLEHSSEMIIPLVFVNKSGISYARNQMSGYDVNYLEHAVIFSSYIDTPKNSWEYANRYASTIAHEFFHLYGAEDLYQPYNRLSLAEKYYINDIMLLDHRDISKLVIDDSTAYQIGWNHKLPAIFNEKSWK